jgi:hypothetical protein
VIIPRPACPHRHRGGVSRACLQLHAADWLGRRGCVTPVTDSLIRELSRAGLLTVVEQHSLGRYGTEASWSISSYRNLLVALRLREEGVRGARELRIRLRLRGHRLRDGRIRNDVIALTRKTVTKAVRDMQTELAKPADQTRPRLHLRREAEQTLRVGSRPEFWQQHGLAAPASATLAAVVQDERVRALILPFAELVFDGKPTFPQLERLASMLPDGLFAPGEITEASEPFLGVAVPEWQGNPLIDGLNDVTRADLDAAFDFSRICSARFRVLAATFTDADYPDLPDETRTVIRQLMALAADLIDSMPWGFQLGMVVVFAIGLSRRRRGVPGWFPAPMPLPASPSPAVRISAA